MASRTEIRDQALSLALGERAALIEELLESLDPDTRNRVDERWAKEADDRVEAYRRGELGSLSLEEVRARFGLS